MQSRTLRTFSTRMRVAQVDGTGVARSKLLGVKGLSITSGTRDAAEQRSMN
jgi:hypothetical protein